jgi:hypothetical protein
MEVIRGRSIKEECSLFRDSIVDVFFENCTFDHLIVSDLHFERVSFVKCTFDHVFVESFCAKDVLFSECSVLSMSLRGDREVTNKRLFQLIKNRQIEEVRFENTNVDDLVLGGNLKIINCDLPQGDNYLRIRNPFLVYNKCLLYINENWTGEQKRIGVISIDSYISKGIVSQNEDFVTFSYNRHLEPSVNEILRSIFLLIKEVSSLEDALIL